MKQFFLLLLVCVAIACGKDSAEADQSTTEPTTTTNLDDASAPSSISSTPQNSASGSNTGTPTAPNSTPSTGTPAPQYEDMSGHPTDIPGLIRAQADYSAGGQHMIGYVAYPEGATGKLPAVIVVHEWWGHNNYARSRADQLAALGYVAMAVDMYGDGKQAAHPDDAGSFAMSVMGDPEVAKTRFGAALSVLRNYPFVDGNKIAAVGYCFGGSVALSMANAGYDLDAVAAFHSGVTLPIWPEGENTVKAKILVCNGADDPFIEAKDVATYKANMDASGADYEYISYPGAVHAFTDPGADAKGAQFDLPLAYNAAADADSWEKLKELLSSVFGS